MIKFYPIKVVIRKIIDALSKAFANTKELLDIPLLTDELVHITTIFVCLILNN